MHLRHRLIVAIALVATACSGVASSAPADDGPVASGTATDTVSEASSSVTTESTSATSPENSPPNAACSIEGDPQPWDEMMSVTLETIIDEDGIRVDAAIYPHPDYQGKPWSQWGQGIALDDGRFLSAIGDHHGVDGNSFLYEYDPDTNALTMFADLRTVLSHEEGSWGYGKVHAQMVEGPCGVYVASYWGTKRNLSFDDNYQGDHLMLVDPVAETITDLDLVLPQHGVPSMASDPASGLIFAEAVNPLVSPKDGPFVVLDQTGSEVFRSEAPHDGYRSMAVDASGRVYFSSGNGGLNRYDPASNTVDELGQVLPGDIIRAATPPDASGTIYAVTRIPSEFITISADGSVSTFGSARGYTTSLALAPAGDVVFYVPYAHGGSARDGTPVLAVDTSTGDEREIVLLNDAAEETFGLTLGGTYSIAIDDTGTTIYLGMNAGPVGSGDTFGEVVLFVVHIDA